MAKSTDIKPPVLIEPGQAYSIAGLFESTFDNLLAKCDTSVVTLFSATFKQQFA